MKELKYGRTAPPRHQTPNNPAEVEFTDRRPVIILDLDQTTWTHRTVQTMYGQQDDIILRPHLQEFLETCAPLFRLAIWTAASPEWALMGLEQIKADTGFDLRSRAVFIWTRERCAYRYDEHTNTRVLHKPLQKVWRSGPFTREQTLAVDDLPENFVTAYGNFIHVKPYSGDAEDTELRDLARYLTVLHPHGNYRRVEKRGWKNRLN